MEKVEIIKNQNEIVKCIINTVDINRIYIFGSYARCEQTEDSDVDLYIILKDENILKNMQDRLDISYKIKENLIKKNLYFRMDLLLSTQKKYDLKKNVNGCIEYIVEREGICIYEEN